MKRYYVNIINQIFQPKDMGNQKTTLQNTNESIRLCQSYIYLHSTVSLYMHATVTVLYVRETKHHQ